VSKEKYANLMWDLFGVWDEFRHKLGEKSVIRTSGTESVLEIAGKVVATVDWQTVRNLLGLKDEDDDDE